MDQNRAVHQTQYKLKQVMTPIWDAAMGRRLRIAREFMLRRQEDLAELLSTPGRPIHRQQIDQIERLAYRNNQKRLIVKNIFWARLDAVFGKHLAYILVGRDEASYDATAIHLRFYNHFQQVMRKRRNGPDPKLGEAPPAKPRFDLKTRIRMGRELPKKRGSNFG